MKSEKWAKHACLLFKNGGLVVAVHNTQYEHAERRACKIAERRGLKPDLALVIRVNNQGQLKNSKPCPNCKKALKKLGVKRVIFSVDNGFRMWYMRATRIKEEKLE